jgi:hypothetical protein
VSGGLFLAVCGVRPDLGAAWTHWNVVLKQVFPPVLALGGLGLTLRLSRPGAPAGGWLWLLLAVPAALAAAMAVELVRLPPEAWAMAVQGKSRAFCLTFIPMISAPVTAVSLWLLRRGAPTRPWLCGLVAGLASAGAGATMYAFFCTDDNPLFYGTSYVGAILIVGVVAGFAGSRLLRW